MRPQADAEAELQQRHAQLLRRYSLSVLALLVQTYKHCQADAELLRRYSRSVLALLVVPQKRKKIDT